MKNRTRWATYAALALLIAVALFVMGAGTQFDWIVAKKVTVQSGGLDVSGVTVLADALDVSGATTLNSTLQVDGALATAAITATGLTVNGSANITGATSAASVTATGLTVNGNANITGATSAASVTATGLTVNGNANITGTFNASGNSTVGGTFAVTGDTGLSADLLFAAQTAVAVTAGNIITPTGTLQEITASGAVSTNLIADATGSGTILILVNSSANEITLAEAGGNLVLSADTVLGQWDTITLVNWVGNWIEIAQADN